jgi:hypothetical protein
VKIEIKFTTDQDSDVTSQLSGLDGKTLTTEHVNIFNLSTNVDTFPDGNGGILPGHHGELRMTANGEMAVWSEWK